MSKYICDICGYIYDEATGIPASGIAPGTTWDQLPDNWRCPICGASKNDFHQVGEMPSSKPEVASNNTLANAVHSDMKEMSSAMIYALCMNLAKGCEKQYLAKEQSLFLELASYYKEKSSPQLDGDYSELLKRINEELMNDYPSANNEASIHSDRGAKRALTWSEKVTRILQSILKQYETDKNFLSEHTDIYVCEICGFIYIGNEPPAICPVCKVPNKKLTKVERGR